MSISAIAAAIAKATGEPFFPGRRMELAGGCINQALKLDDGRRRFFVKLNQARYLDMFEAEADGLREMEATHTVRVPHPVCAGVADNQAFLVLEYLELGGGSAEAEMGRQLAEMHRHSAGAFGWGRDNTIGSTPQRNDWCQDWIAFFRDRRLGDQLALAAANGLGVPLQNLGERLQENIGWFFRHYQPVPSLLHGDLWGGNAAFLPSGEPVIFDPAVYYGDREADLAMTELFGGFGQRFYMSYSEAWALDAGYGLRKPLYNLYHLLNHANLFGGAYVRQSESVMRHLLDRLAINN